MHGIRAVAVLALLAECLCTTAAPGCGCPVSACCGEDLFADAFVDILTEQGQTSPASVSNSVFGSHAWAPACSLLNLIPGIELEGGLCHRNTTNSGSLDVCGATAADETAVDVLELGSPRVGVFAEPGACSELENGICWRTPGGGETWLAQWVHYRSTAVLPGSQSCSSTSVHRAGDASPALLVGIQCPANSGHPDGLRVIMKWVDPASTERACDMEGDLDEVVGADGWTAGDRPGAPRWACFDVPLSSLGEQSYRAVLYSVGELPCVLQADATTGATTTTDAATGPGLIGVAAPLLLSCVFAMGFQIAP